MMNTTIFIYSNTKAFPTCISYIIQVQKDSLNTNQSRCHIWSLCAKRIGIIRDIRIIIAKQIYKDAEARKMFVIHDIYLRNDQEIIELFERFPNDLNIEVIDGRQTIIKSIELPRNMLSWAKNISNESQKLCYYSIIHALYVSA